MRFLGQLARSAPDQVWALVSWYTEYQPALRLSGAWFHDIMHATCPLGKIDVDWSSWSLLLKEQPGRWKGLLRRAETWDIEMHRLHGSVDTAVRALWPPRSSEAGSYLSCLTHACLQCGLAFAGREEWGAHAQRVHGYRNAAARIAQGRLCRACNTLYSTGARLKTHLLASARCRSFLETAEPDSLPPPVLGTSDGHTQAPAVRGVASGSLPPAREDLCYELMVEFEALQDATDQEIFDLVQAPLPVLRCTLQKWAEALPPGILADNAADVLLLLTPEHLCSRVCGKLPEQVDAPPFVPEIVPPVYRPPSERLEVLWHGTLNRAWIATFLPG